MPPSPQSSPSRAGSGLIGSSLSPASAVNSATPSSSQSPSIAASVPVHGVAAIISVIVVLSFLLLGLASWIIAVRRRGKGAASAPAMRKLGLFSPASVPNTPIPSILDASSPLAHSTLTATTNFDSIPGVNVNLMEPQSIAKGPQHKETKDPSFPPGLMVTPPPSSLQIPTPPSSAKISALAVTPHRGVLSKGFLKPSAKLPRLVVVDFTFPATLHDELHIRKGETLRLLAEYEDQWCLVQRVGRPDAEKGVIPQFCIEDKPGITLMMKSKHISRISSRKA